VPPRCTPGGAARARQIPACAIGHLLFVYPRHLDLDAHEVAVRELVRVTHGEVRMYPLVDTLAQPYPHFDALLDLLAQCGIVSELRRAECAWQPAGDRLLVCRSLQDGNT